MIKAAVVGYGYSGRSFHTYLAPMAEGIELGAIVSGSPAHQEAIRAEHPEARLYPTMDEMLADGSIDLVILATPHDTHKDLAVQAMEAGKNVVTDKIMALNAAQAEEMIAARDRNGVMLSVFHNRRWDWDYLTVKQAIADGLLGRPYLFEASVLGYSEPRGWRSMRSKVGSILFDWGAHFVDQALQLVDAPVASVFCDCQYHHSHSDIESYARLRLRFANDVIYVVELGTMALAGKPRWFVLGDRGALVKQGLDPQEGPMRERRIETAREDPANRAHVTTLRSGRQEELVLETVQGTWKSYYQNISDVLNKGAELIVKPEQALACLRVFDAAMQSVETGQAVEL
jgi:scyllo-inositol 2-dehydrogenase (NADP+)